jgi:hypothetical protein
MKKGLLNGSPFLVCENIQCFFLIIDSYICVMMSVKEIMAPVSVEMQDFEARFRKSMESQVPLLDKVTHYVVRRKGKQMRPLFILLSFFTPQRLFMMMLLMMQTNDVVFSVLTPFGKIRSPYWLEIICYRRFCCYP